MSTCRSCSTEIIWAEHHATGRRMPLDAAPVDRDTPAAFTVHHGKAYPVSAAPRYLTGVTWHISHFATCPDGDQFRRSR